MGFYFLKKKKDKLFFKVFEWLSFVKLCNDIQWILK